MCVKLGSTNAVSLTEFF